MKKYLCKIFHPRLPRQEFLLSSWDLATGAMHEKLRGYYLTSMDDVPDFKKKFRMYYRDDGSPAGSVEEV